MTWNVRGDGKFIARAGWGYYVTLNQPFFELVSQQQLLGTRLFITDPQKLRLYPDIKGLAQSNLEFLTAFFGEGLGNLDSLWYSHAVRWRNNRRTCRFLNDQIVRKEDSVFESMKGSLPDSFSRWEPLALVGPSELAQDQGAG